MIVNKLSCVVLAFWCASVLGGCAALASEEAVVACQVADTATTLHAVDLGAREANPVVDFILKTYGPGGFIAAKIAVTLLFLLVYPDLSSGAVILVNGVTCGVAAHNALVAAELKGRVQVSE